MADPHRFDAPSRDATLRGILSRAPERFGDGASGADHLLPLPPLHPAVFINRELSWLDFNQRVLAEACDARHPLLERVKFLAIFSSNLDEFFMIRVAGVKRKIHAGLLEQGADGRTPVAQYAAIRERTQDLLREQSRVYERVILPRLRRHRIALTRVDRLPRSSQDMLERYFRREVFPVLTPQAIDHARRFPHISNGSLNLFVRLETRGTSRFARVKIPAVLPRLIDVPEDDLIEGRPRRFRFVWLEDLVAAHLDLLFPGHDTIESYPFHVTRDADIELDEDDEVAHDLIAVMRELLSERTFGSVVRLTVDRSMPIDTREWLLEQIGATPRELYVVDGPLALDDLWDLTAIDRPDLKDMPLNPAPLETPRSSDNSLADRTTWGGRDIFDRIREGDVIAHHPYQAFGIVTDFLTAAATDPAVVAIKQTLYRIGRDSPLIPALIEARDEDTQVAVLVELKARFDEENNISWAQQLEHEGVHVAYGVTGLKTHCKLTLVVRREEEGLQRYAHLATGNYNATTARLYEDIGIFTARAEITHEVSELFNALTGFSEGQTYDTLWVAPTEMRARFLEAIQREIMAHRQHGNGYLFFKMNSLVDKEVIRALYAASREGVCIDLIVRGACCLRPGVEGWSETIRVRSVVGRFLEHSRLYYFSHGGNDMLLLGSADLMERNFDRRIEVLFPVLEPLIRDHIRDVVIPAYLQDNENAWDLTLPGEWIKARAPRGRQRFDVQRYFMDHYALAANAGAGVTTDAG
jgi:polyphosphate kinase